MKFNILFAISFIIMIVLTIITVFFLNRFLFFIHGFTWEPKDSLTVEKFKAYKAIYPSKVVIIFGGFVASLALLIYSRKMLFHNPQQLYQLIYVACWIIFIVFLIFVVFFFVVPRGGMI